MRTIIQHATMALRPENPSAHKSKPGPEGCCYPRAGIVEAKSAARIMYTIYNTSASRCDRLEGTTRYQDRHLSMMISVPHEAAEGSVHFQFNPMQIRILYLPEHGINGAEQPD